MKALLLLITVLLLAVGILQHLIIRQDRKRRHRMGHDELTGICNWEHLVQMAELLNKSDWPRYVIYSDIGGFKLINEVFGRAMGNEILRRQAELIKRFVREGDIYGRSGEDHFVVIVEQAHFREEYLEECRREMQKVLDNPAYQVQVYFGIYKAEHFHEPLASMCDKASLAIQSIKGDLERFVAYYDDSMMENAVKSKAVIDEFDVALENGEFQMYLQPQIMAGSGKLHGAEALVRRIRPDGQVIPPMEFIPVYEKTGLIYRLDLYIWEQAAKKLSEWKQDGVELNISVNISPRDFYYVDIYNTFMNLVGKYEIAPEHLNIEITETAIMSDVPNLRSDLERLQAAGFIVEIDDFGSGYSSLNTLKDINVDTLKIDMGFLRESENHEKGRIILNSVVRMAKELGMPVITEGVETREQVHDLTHMGCDTFQGYYFSKPVDVETFERRYLHREG